MAAGGATWDTAGTLTLGGSNTFDVADTTDEPPLYDLAWWTFTPGVPGLLTLSPDDYATIIYHGTDAARVQDFPLSGYGNAWLLTEGVEYRILASRGEFDSPPDSGTYEIAAASQRWTASAWNDSLQNDPDNILIITPGALVDANPNPGFSSSFMPEWTEDVIRRGQRRRGDYYAQQTLDVPQVYDPIDAFSCVMSHADFGEDDHQLWNTSTTDPGDNGPPNCRILPTLPALADASTETVLTGYSLDYSPGGMISATAEAVVSGPSWFLWFLPVRDNIQPWGTLFGFSLSPEDYGYPADAVLEWEGGDGPADLLGIELADADPLDTGAAPFKHQWALNTRWAPRWEAGYSTEWWLGPISDAPTLPIANRPHMLWDYEDGGPPDGDWQPVEDSAGWDGHDWTEDYETVVDEAPTETDGVVVAWPYTQSIVEFDDERLARIAVKFLLQAKRFRFVYPGGPIPPRRIRQRSDGATHGARSANRSRNTRQGGNRTVGAIL